MVRPLLFTVVVLALLFWLGRELWRVIGPALKAARDRRAQEALLAERTEETLKTPGATPADPVEVTSASVVESRATADPCVVCGERVHADAHAVETFGDTHLRVVRLACRRCGHRRPFYVRIAERPAVH